MAAPNVNKRIITEVTKLQALGTGSDASGVKFLLDKSPIDNPSSNVILGRILPNSNIYNQAAFQIEIKLPAEYPFKAPEVRFVTSIFHPNVDDKGKICVDILNSGETFKPTTPLTDVVKAVVNLIDNPNIDHALTPGRIPTTFWKNEKCDWPCLFLEIAALYTSKRAEFDKRALEMVKSHGLPRQ